ncbi:MAG: invasion associated locus B family protein [Siculibacillus sp.]|nr:invasion associated locus B family protein [Siculibacillus sp.]
MIVKVAVAGLTTAVVALGAGTAGAQSPNPDSSNTTYQDWTVNCAFPAAPADAKPAEPKAADPKAAAKSAAICEMVQQFTDRKTQRVFARVAIGKGAGTGEAKVAIQVGAGVLLPPGFVLAINEKTQVKGAYLRCVSDVCTGDADIKKDVLDQAKTAEKMTLTFTDPAGRPVLLQLSSKGFSTALAAMNAGK